MNVTSWFRDTWCRPSVLVVETPRETEHRGDQHRPGRLFILSDTTKRHGQTFCLLFTSLFTASCWLENRARDRKVAGSIPTEEPLIVPRGTVARAAYCPRRACSLLPSSVFTSSLLSI